MSIWHSISKANLDSRSSQLDKPLENRYDFLYFKRFGFFEHYIFQKFVLCIVSETKDPLQIFQLARIFCLTVSRHLPFFSVLIPSLSPHHTSLKNLTGVLPPILFCALDRPSVCRAADVGQLTLTPSGGGAASQLHPWVQLLFSNPLLEHDLFW